MIVLAIVLAVIVVLAVVLVVNAVRLKPTPVADPLPPSDVRGDDAAVERFQEMLRCPTVWGLHLSLIHIYFVIAGTFFHRVPR